jgi:hypothetical protein
MSKKAANTYFKELVDQIEGQAKECDLTLAFHEDIGFTLSDGEETFLMGYNPEEVSRFLQGYASGQMHEQDESNEALETLHQIKDALYRDIDVDENDEDVVFYNPDKSWSPDTTQQVADIIVELFGDPSTY